MKCFRPHFATWLVNRHFRLYVLFVRADRWPSSSMVPSLFWSFWVTVTERVFTHLCRTFLPVSLFELVQYFGHDTLVSTVWWDELTWVLWIICVFTGWESNVMNLLLLIHIYFLGNEYTLILRHIRCWSFELLRNFLLLMQRCNFRNGVNCVDLCLIGYKLLGATTILSK